MADEPDNETPESTETPEASAPDTAAAPEVEAPTSETAEEPVEAARRDPGVGLELGCGPGRERAPDHRVPAAFPHLPCDP